MAVATPGAQPHGPFARKPTEALVAEASDGHGLKRAVGALDLTALGLGAIIGTGIFVIVGEAIGKTGPSIILSFVLAAVTCAFSALSYSEMASTIPVSGSAYTYGYATLGELLAWIIGWDLIIEYGFAMAVVAVGWGGYVQDLLSSVFGIHLPNAISQPPGEGGSINLPAVVLVLGVTAVLLAGVRQSARTNTVMVLTKVVILVMFIALGIAHFKGSHFTPFATHGKGGIVDAAALIFFAYIGFDAVSTSGEEAKRPDRDLPRAIVGSLAIATVLYILVSVTAIGLAPPGRLSGSEAPLTDALRLGGGYGAWAGDILSLGALIAITSVVLTLFYGQTRIMFAMCRDGLLPRGLARLSTRQVPVVITVVLGVIVAALAAVIPLASLAELVNIGTLFAFLIVNIGVIVLRRTQPGLQRGFRVPFVPVFPLIGAALCIWLMTKLAAPTWWRFGIWLVVGLAIYALYGRTHSRLQRGEALPREEPAGGAPGA